MTRIVRRSFTTPLAAAAVLLVLGCSKGTAGTEQAPAPAPGTESPAAPVASAAPAPAAPAPVPPAPGTPEAASAAQASPAAAPAAAPAPDPVLPSDQIPDVVARANGREFSKADLLARAAEARSALAQRGVPPPQPTRGFYRSVLDDLIGNHLLYLELSAQGKAAAQKDVDDQLAALRGQFASDQEFDAALAQRGFDRERLKRDIAESLTVNGWIEGTVIPSIQVTDAEQRQFFTENQERMIQPEGVRVRHILVSVAAADGPEQKTAKRKEADELRARLVAGADFAAVARESSDDPGSAAKGGELGWLRRGQTVPSFEAAAFALPAGQLSEVVESRFGYHLLEVEEKRAESKLGFEEVQPRIEAAIRQHKVEQAVRAKLNELGSKAKIEILI